MRADLRARRRVRAGMPGPARKRAPGSITTDHRYDLPLPREDVWTLISEVSRYRRWWPWLRAFEAVALAEGEEWRCEVQPPCPTRFGSASSSGTIEAAGAGARRVSGDVVGHATLPRRSFFGVRRATLQARSRRGTRPCRWSPGLPPPSPVSAMTGSSIRGPASSSPALSSRSWATRQPWREVLVSARSWPPPPGPCSLP